MKPLVVKGLSLTLNERTLLKGFNLTFYEGQIYGILGPNGAGKTTFLKTIAGLLPKYYGKVILLERELRAYSLKELGKIRSYLPQRNGSLPELTVWETVLFGRIPHLGFEVSNRDLERVSQVLERLDLEALAYRKLSELSGGELQKVLLARALAQEPKVLLLDEPFNHLDPKNQLEILRLISEETEQNKLITILVLHDINLALRFCSYLLLIKEGKVRYFGKTEEIEGKHLSEVYELEISFVQKDGIKLAFY